MYKEGGFEVFKPAKRNDTTSSTIHEELVNEAILLQREVPSRSLHWGFVTDEGDLVRAKKLMTVKADSYLIEISRFTPVQLFSSSPKE